MISEDNFRDIGGLKTEDGKLIQSGFVFRSSQLSAIPVTELRELLDKRGIKRIIDLRTSEEIQKHGSYPPEVLSNVEYIQYPLQCEGIPIDEVLRRERELTGNKYLYYHLLKNETRMYRKTFDIMAKAKERPVVIHCIAGKDRTGIAIALLLLALKVRKEEILTDYLKTPRADAENFLLLLKLIEENGGISTYLSNAGIEPATVDELRDFLVK